MDDRLPDYAPDSEYNKLDIPPQIQQAINRAVEQTRVPFKHSDCKQGLLFSPFIRRICRTYPDQFEQLIQESSFLESYTDNQLVSKLNTRIDTADDEKTLAALLRQMRHLELARIALRELIGLSETPETLTDLSNLAAACVDLATRKHLSWLSARYGQPVSQLNHDTAKFVVFGLGKLGGCELNFSSDIDLIFAFSDQGVTDGSKSISNNEFFLKLGQTIIKTLNQVTPDGIVYRVDMRLRPNGQSGPLVMSFSAMENYYQIHGREWERYAWIKARPIAGSIQAGEDFLASLRPFIYRKYLDYQVYESIKDMKEMINQEIKQQGMLNNIKLGRGGIREVEFIVQSHQLVRGGRENSLRTGSLQQALFALNKLGQLTDEVADQLYSSYLFLRKVENRLQMVNDEQLHQLPETEHELEVLAASMGLSRVQFTQKLNPTREFIHNQFNRLHSTQKNESKVENQWKLLWHRAVDEGATKIVDQSADDNTSQLEPALKAYGKSKEYRRLTTQGRRSVDILVPKILQLVSAQDQSAQTLSRSLNIISQIGGRTAYLRLLNKFPVALEQLITLCAASPWVSRWIADHPIVLDTLINPRTDQYVFNAADLGAVFEARLKGENDDELKHDILRQIHHVCILQIAIADLQSQYDAYEIRGFISRVAQAVVLQVIKFCQQELAQKFGFPISNSHAEYFCVIAYGKLGSKELSYNSDLDLVFIYDEQVLAEQTQGGRKSVSIDYYFSRLVSRIMTMLSMQTSAGKLYEVDTRLRPSGKAGFLVSSLKQYAKYQTEQAWVWEHQALVKARLLSESPELVEKFEQIRRAVLSQKRPVSSLKEQIVDMRERMQKSAGTAEFSCKFDRGAMVDIEFITQYLCLAYPRSQLIQSRSVESILKAAAQCNIIDKHDANCLIQTYQALLEYESRYKLTNFIDKSMIRKLKAGMIDVQKIWQKILA